MFLEVEQFLTPDEVSEALAIAARSGFVDGLATLPGGDRSLKDNEQMEPAPADQARLDAIFAAAMGRNPEVQFFTQPKAARPLMLSRYRPGMHYGLHLDAPILMQGTPLRTDISMTVFLAEPDSYDGGALVLETDFGSVECKMAPGGAVLYSTLLWHEVEPVTRGERLAMVTWFQSRVQDPMLRAILFDACMASRLLAASEPDSPAARRVRRIENMLTKLWSNV